MREQIATEAIDAKIRRGDTDIDLPAHRLAVTVDDLDGRRVFRDDEHPVTTRRRLHALDVAVELDARGARHRLRAHTGQFTARAQVQPIADESAKRAVHAR